MASQQIWDLYFFTLSQLKEIRQNKSIITQPTNPIFPSAAEMCCNCVTTLMSGKAPTVTVWIRLHHLQLNTHIAQIVKGRKTPSNSANGTPAGDSALLLPAQNKCTSETDMSHAFLMLVNSACNHWTFGSQRASDMCHRSWTPPSHTDIQAAVLSAFPSSHITITRTLFIAITEPQSSDCPSGAHANTEALYFLDTFKKKTTFAS